MHNKLHVFRVRTLALCSMSQALAAVCCLGSAQAQAITSPLERTVSGEADSFQVIPLEIPAGTKTLSIAISGGTGDPDLYVRRGEQPDFEAFDCRPWIDGSDEKCDFTDPQSGTWYIGLHAWTAFADTKLSASWDAPVVTEPSDPPQGALSAWEQEMLDEHNLLRAKHCSPDMTWDAELAKAAQAWADNCKFEHAQGTGMGENLFVEAGQVSNGKSVADGWYSEIAKYDFANPGTSSGTGHFSQLVWKASTRLGCARALNCTGAQIDADWSSFPTADLVVCRYAPQGNIAGAYAANVSPVQQGGTCE